MMKRVLVGAMAGVIAVGGMVASPAQAGLHGDQDGAGEVIAEHLSVGVVLDGAMGSARGNQHRFVYQTDLEGRASSASAKKITSYFCPSGSKITQTWASSKCVYRGTSYLRIDRADYRVSSTMHSAVIYGPLTSGSKSFHGDLTLYARGELKQGTSYSGVRTRYTDAVVSGTVDGAKVRQETNEGGSIHRHERR